MYMHMWMRICIRRSYHKETIIQKYDVRHNESELCFWVKSKESADETHKKTTKSMIWPRGVLCFMGRNFAYGSAQETE